MLAHTLNTNPLPLRSSTTPPPVAEQTAHLNPAQLGDKARRLLAQITGPGYRQWQLRRVLDMSGASDPALLERAEAATAFVNGSFVDNEGSEPNPFAGLSRGQLAIIAYDESGAYTVNERRAAYMESYRLEERWHLNAVARAQSEYNRSGKLTNFFKDVLAHYQSLPLMEQVLYPPTYSSELKARIERDFNFLAAINFGGGSQDWVLAAKSFLRPMLPPG